VLRIADEDDLSSVIGPLQLAAAAAPGTSITDLVGNFGDLYKLFEQVSQPHLIELGKPLPRKKYLPRKPAGSCPAAHNQALLDKGSR
jgi:hypothetical protein